MFLLSIRQIEIENEDTGETTIGWWIANRDGNGNGDVVRAIWASRDPSSPCSGRHPALRTYSSREEAVAAAERLGRDLVKRKGGTFELLSGE